MNHGSFDFAFKAAAILMDILWDPNDFWKGFAFPYVPTTSVSDPALYSLGI